MLIAQRFLVSSGNQVMVHIAEIVFSVIFKGIKSL